MAPATGLYLRLIGVFSIMASGFIWLGTVNPPTVQVRYAPTPIPAELLP